jgi:hypothetical protein
MNAENTEKRIEKWNLNDLGEEASLKDTDEISRQARRGDESKGDPDNRDAAGAPNSIDTPQGREEAKNDKKGAANANG